MGNKPDVISLQGELFLAKIINGAVSGMFPVGSMPALQLQITSDSTDHYESKTGFVRKMQYYESRQEYL